MTVATQFDPVAFADERKKRIAESKAANHTHLDQFRIMGCEQVRGVRVQYLHQPNDFAIMHSIDNRGTIWLKKGPQSCPSNRWIEPDERQDWRLT